MTTANTTRYYALLDTSEIVYLGAYTSFCDADEASPGNTVWILDRDTLADWGYSIITALKEDIMPNPAATTETPIETPIKASAPKAKKYGYNGYDSWAQWNVSLWINNDEGLYRLAQSLLCRYSKAHAAVELYNMLVSNGITRTPDGAKYTVTSIRAALTGM